MDPSKWIEWVKLPPKLLFALTTVSGVLVFAPMSLLAQMGLWELVEGFRGWLGAAFLLFAALLAAHFGSWVYSTARPWVVQFCLIRRGRLRLRNIDDREKKLLASFVNENTRSLRVDIEDGTVHVLERERILSQVSKIGNFEDGFAYAVQPWAWEYIQEYPEILKPYLTHSTRTRTKTERAS